MASLVKRGDKWLARVIRTGFPAQNKTFDNKTDAARWARSVESAMDGEVFKDKRKADKLLVTDLIERYIESHLGKQMRNRSEWYRLRAMGRDIGAYSVENLTPLVIHDYMTKRLSRVKPATVEREINQLHGMFSFAIKNWGLKCSNPVKGVQRPKFSNRRERIATEAELTLLFHELSNRNNSRRHPYMCEMAQLALETAMRRGELHHLKWADVNLERRFVTLHKTKNGDRRLVPLSNRAVEIFESIERKREQVFHGLKYEAFSGVWARACERAGVVDFRFHDLRHMAVTRISRKVPNIVELSRISGHRNIQNLERYYHTTVEELAEKLG